MKLSDAIRLGAMNRPQAFAVFYDEDTTGTCALGAALDACGQLNIADIYDGAQNTFIATEWPLPIFVRCPACNALLGDTFCIVSHLNDCHRWTRDRIADFVQTLEERDNRPTDQPEDVRGTTEPGAPVLATRGSSSSSSSNSSPPGRARETAE